jgi:membrane protein implicated in regulation of membrane protease activity
MGALRETYDLPERPPLPYRVWLLCLAVPALALGLWFVFPDSTVTLVLLFAAICVAVFTGLWHILRDPELEEPPGLDPMPPPSAGRRRVDR